jgi:hypothetical protein
MNLSSISNRCDFKACLELLDQYPQLNLLGPSVLWLYSEYAQSLSQGVQSQDSFFSRLFIGANGLEQGTGYGIGLEKLIMTSNHLNLLSRGPCTKVVYDKVVATFGQCFGGIPTVIKVCDAFGEEIEIEWEDPVETILSSKSAAGNTEYTEQELIALFNKRVEAVNKNVEMASEIHYTFNSSNGHQQHHVHLYMDKASRVRGTLGLTSITNVVLSKNRQWTGQCLDYADFGTTNESKSVIYQG